MRQGKEHLDGLKRSKICTPLGDHKAQKHRDEEIVVKVTILAREQDISARRTLEALWITAKSPRINRKDECIEVTRELALFAELCAL